MKINYKNNKIAVSILCIAGLAFFALSSQARLFDIVTYAPPVPYTPLQIISSIPADNQQLTPVPKTVSATFTQNIAPEASSLKVYDQYNALVNATPVITSGVTNSMTVNLPSGLMAGGYRVEWNVQCLCPQKNTASGIFRFSVY